MTPEGKELTAGDLLGRANQLVHGLRRLDLEPGDVVATLLPNCAEMFELYLAALQAGWYLVPINHHLVAPEIAYILKDSGAKAFVGHERFADVGARRGRRGRAPVGGVPGRRRRSSGSPPTPSSATPSRRRCPPDRTIGDVMNYTSGTTGNPKGVFRPL